MANKAKLEEIMKDESNVAALKACETEEAALAFLNEKGAELTAAELQLAMPGSDEAMDLDQMDAIAGGGLIDAIKDLFSVGIHKQSPDDVIESRQLENGYLRKVYRNGRVTDEKEGANGVRRVIEYESVRALMPTKDTITVNGTTYATPDELRAY